jgi:RND family efflux transporter MFP subunit
VSASRWFLLALALACGDAAAADKKSAPRAAQAAREVRLVKVAAQQLGRTVHVSGTLAADEQVTVSVKVAGRLASIGVDLGSVVTRGQAIAQIEATDYQLRVEQAASALAQARAQLGLAPDGDDVEIDLSQTSLVREAQASYDEARANLDRARSLVDQRMIAVADFDTAKATFVRAESAVAKARDEIRNRQAALRQRSFELRAARQQLADTVVRAPLDGIVHERHALAGEYLAAGSSVATVVSVDPLRLRVEIPERDAALVRAGQTVRIHVDGDAREGRMQTGKVVRLAPALNEQSRSLAIEAEVANSGQLRPGSFARAEILVDDASAVPVVPASAVVSFAGIDKVIAVAGGKAVEKPIAVGRRDERWVEVVSGVALGDAVVVEPGNLQQGQPVRVTGEH